MGEGAILSILVNPQIPYNSREQDNRRFDKEIALLLYQQNPKPLQGLMYESGFKEYDIIPYTKQAIRKNYTDTADEGKDYLCSICYVETEIGNFVIDVLYTTKPMEYTEPRTAEMLSKHQIKEAVIESNNGGRSFARAVESQCRIMQNNLTKIKWFHQSENKNIYQLRRRTKPNLLPPWVGATLAGVLQSPNNLHESR